MLFGVCVSSWRCAQSRKCQVRTHTMSPMEDTTCMRNVKVCPPNFRQKAPRPPPKPDQIRGQRAHSHSRNQHHTPSSPAHHTHKRVAVWRQWRCSALVGKHCACTRRGGKVRECGCGFWDNKLSKTVRRVARGSEMNNSTPLHVHIPVYVCVCVWHVYYTRKIMVI